MSLHDLVEQLLYEEESDCLDFKSEQYRFISASDEDKSELLKDIVAFANSWRRSDAYILVGVKEVKGGRSEVVGITEHLDDAQLQQFVYSKTQKPLQFSYKTILYGDAQIGIIHIPVQRRPFYLKKDYGRLKKSEVYIRRGSSTVIATIDEISIMGIEARGALPAFDVSLVSGTHDEITTKSFSDSLIHSSYPRQEDIPDYERSVSFGGTGLRINDWECNSRYYRQLARFLQAYTNSRGFKFAVQNTSSVTARDVKVVFELSGDGGTTIACTSADMPLIPSRKNEIFPLHSRAIDIKDVPDVTMTKTANGWRVTCTLGKIQAKETVLTKHRLYLGSVVTKTIYIEAKVFSDDLPEPMHEALQVDYEVQQRTYSIDDFLDEFNGTDDILGTAG